MIKIILFLVTVFYFKIGMSQTFETIATGDNFGEITVIGNTLYRGGQEATVVTYDLSTADFDAITIATGPGSNPHLRFAVNPSEQNVYISEFAGPIFAADISESNLTLIAQGMTTGGEVLGMAISGNTVYYSTTAPQVLRFEMNDPDSTQEVFFDPASVLPIFNMIIEGDLLYYSTQSDFNEPIEYQVFSLDITQADPTPQLVTTTPERAWSFAIEGDALYIASDQNNTVYFKDLSDGTTQAATVVRALDLGTNTNIYSLDLENDFFYFSATGDQGGIFRLGIESLSVADNSLGEVKLFPNPSNDFMYISGVDDLQKYKVISADGRCVLEGTVSHTVSINIRALSKGIYILSIPSVGSYPFIKK